MSETLICELLIHTAGGPEAQHTLSLVRSGESTKGEKADEDEVKTNNGLRSSLGQEKVLKRFSERKSEEM